MKTKISRSGSRRIIRYLITVVTTILLVPGIGLLFANDVSAQAAEQQAARIPADQLDSLVAPIALYPDPLLSQTLVASTYPLEIMQLQQWLSRNPNLKDKALMDAVAKQPWDPSIQAMAALPDVVKRLADDIQWTTDLGNAFLAQQGDVMDAVQRMRQRAQGKGALKSNQQQKVETQVVENKTVIVVEQADPQVIYVPSYDPMYAYGAPIYPYPPIYYPPYTPGVGLISFGLGMAIGAAWGGGGWGWGCGWGNNDININRNNSFNRNTNINAGNRNNIGNGNKWQHNPTHRGGAPYGDRNTANRFGGTTRGDSLNNRQASAKQQVGRQGGNLSSSSRAGDRGVGAGASDRSRSSGVAGDRASRDSSGGASNRGGGDRVGSRDVGRSSSSGKSGAFGSGSGGFSGSNARSSSSRGSSSMGSRGGGMSRGGGGGRRR